MLSSCNVQRVCCFGASDSLAIMAQEKCLHYITLLLNAYLLDKQKIGDLIHDYLDRNDSASEYESDIDSNGHSADQHRQNAHQRDILHQRENVLPSGEVSRHRRLLFVDWSPLFNAFNTINVQHTRVACVTKQPAERFGAPLKTCKLGLMFVHFALPA